MHTDLGILENPIPIGCAMNPGTGFITADQSAAAQARQDLLHPVVQTEVFTRRKRFARAPSLMGTLYTCAKARTGERN